MKCYVTIMKYVQVYIGKLDPIIISYTYYRILQYPVNTNYNKWPLERLSEMLYKISSPILEKKTKHGGSDGTAFASGSKGCGLESHWILWDLLQECTIMMRNLLIGNHSIMG